MMLCPRGTKSSREAQKKSLHARKNSFVKVPLLRPERAEETA